MPKDLVDTLRGGAAASATKQMTRAPTHGQSGRAHTHDYNATTRTYPCGDKTPRKKPSFSRPRLCTYADDGAQALSSPSCMLMSAPQGLRSAPGPDHAGE